MRWSRFLAWALTAALLAATPGPALGSGAQDESAEPAGTAEPEAPAASEDAPEAAPEAAETESEPAGDADDAAARKAERQAQREARAAAGQDDAEAEATSRDDQDEAPAADREAEAGSEDDSDADSDSDADLPALLVFTSDAPGSVIVGAEMEGRVEPGEPLEVRVDLGEVEVRVVSLDVRGAAWEKTLEIEEPGTTLVRVRLKKAMRLFRREERQTGVFRDPKTNLMWPKKDNGLDVDLRQAYAYCRDLGTGGFDGWRLPTLRELRSIEAIWMRSGYKILGDIVLTECCMWSSEYDGSERAWTFNYRFRKPFQTNAGYRLGLRALCVRDWDPETEPEETAAEDEAPDDESEDAKPARRKAKTEDPDEPEDG